MTSTRPTTRLAPGGCVVNGADTVTGDSLGANLMLMDPPRTEAGLAPGPWLKLSRYQHSGDYHCEEKRRSLGPGRT